jgi:hypothetical protein
VSSIIFSAFSQLGDSTFGVCISDIDNIFSTIYDLLALRWVKDFGEIESLNGVDKIKSIVIIGIYDDFTTKNITPFLKYTKLKGVNIYFLVARDLQSLSWLIAKQFLNKKNTIQKSALFSYKKIGSTTLGKLDKKKREWEFFDYRRISSTNIREVLINNAWNSVIFHGHGKEDHINLGDFTLCGLNTSIPETIKCMPSCGHSNQTCFKDVRKTIDAKEIRCVETFLLSCNNAPFCDAKLYDTKVGILLNMIDGCAQNIYASVGIQLIGLPEINKLISLSDSSNNLSNIINYSLDSVQPYACTIMFGLPKIIQNTDVELNQPRLTALSKSIINKVYTYKSCNLLSDEHQTKKSLSNILDFVEKNISRGTYSLNAEQSISFERELINRVNPVSRLMALDINKDPNDELMNFDIYSISRAIVDKNSIRINNCICGLEGLSYNYISEVRSNFDISFDYCYRCGDQGIRMLDSPKISISALDVIKFGESLRIRCFILPSAVGDIFIGCFMPSYISKYVKSKQELKTIKNKNIKEYIYETEVIFDDSIPLQSYYITVFAVQNLGISVFRWFFNIV